MPSRLDYAHQARSYDDTRGASPSVLRPLRAALAAAPGARLLDLGGGTGNYARALREDGFEPLVGDLSQAMLERSRGKGLAAERLDVTSLPFADGEWDAVTMISMLHLVPDWRAALAEATRVLRPGGVLVLQVFLREHLEVHWVFGYFPRSALWVWPEHQTAGELRAALPGLGLTPYRYEDLEDGSLAAMCREPALLLDPDRRSQTSFFERLERDDPDELASGLERLERDLAAARDPTQAAAAARERWGDGVVGRWVRPA